ncbi:rod shape-determining protein MreC [Panacibacter ginsenosidivorans]|uniref:Cell shape-determining protein MreC n=1 Tax=Panacibacter ginsenosidivorans TaxID=1813871 RepID=A0A5B8V9J9_9BACT|nr:rod shape-determining protein MreC [Panacibacter ginsenosidivorans]QEC67531.1 rod shape-determining protein MreC [Panacibacter ginsenosidivorans]
MRNIFLFIRRFFNLILFLVLQGTAIYILTNYNKTHQAVLGAVANEVTGSISTKYNNIEYYFHLKKTNDSLVKENARLHNMQPSSFESADTTNTIKVDSLLKDTMGTRKFLFMEAKVVNSSVSQENNYITLHRGAKQGVKTDMAVIGPDGIVGKVILVSDNYSRVMSLLNRKSKVNAMLKKGFYTGDLEWDGKDPSYLTLSSISKSAKVQKGDTVLTSNVSQELSFPPGLMVGTIAEIIPDPGSSFLTLKIRSATNFYSLQYVYLTENLQWQEQKELEAKTPKD